jgi:hypothetical protein
MPKEISINDAQYALDFVRRICCEVGPGSAGTSQERHRGEIIKKELETHLGSENVVVEDFSFAPDAFLSTIPTVMSMLAAVLFNITLSHVIGSAAWFVSIAAVILSVFPILSFILEFFLSYEVFDFLYPKKISTNVIGSLVRPGSTEIKRLIIISGHHDSALENTWLRYTGRGFYILASIFIIGLIVLLAMCLIQLAGLILGSSTLLHTGTLGWELLLFPIFPAIVFAAFFTRGKKNGGTVPGAADNLSACAVAISTCRFLVENPGYIPSDTEIRFISFGSEEAGLRGSKRYLSRHLDELKCQGVRVLNYEVIAYPEITILSSDVSGTVKNSPELVKSIVIAAQSAGVPYKVSAAAIGTNNDSASFSRAGFQALTLLPFKVPEQQFAFYHQDRDTPEVLSLKPLLNVLKLTIEWIKNGG